MKIKVNKIWLYIIYIYRFHPLTLIKWDVTKAWLLGL